jgi:pentose-5-phosphate-3-epimerase
MSPGSTSSSSHFGNATVAADEVVDRDHLLDTAMCLSSNPGMTGQQKGREARQKKVAERRALINQRQT